MATELHPEDLLERDARGELDEGERVRLEAHLRRCSACRIERIARVDFRREAEELDAPDVQRLLARVLAAPSPGLAQAHPPRSGGRRFWPLLVAAALVSAAAWATVAGRTGSRAPSVVVGPAPSPAVVAAAPTPRVDPIAAVAPAVLAPPEDGPSPVVRAPARRVSSVSLVARPAPAELPSAGRDFDRANTARRSGQHGPAADLYRALVTRYPASPEARASLVALGRMLLDDGDAAGALRSFDQYLSGGGALVEDVMLGRAVALRNLGRPGDELRAWNALVRQYPGSVHADRARRRLVELGAP